VGISVGGKMKTKTQPAQELSAMRRRIAQLEKAEAKLKRMEETLLASQLNLSDAMDLAHIVYWRVDLETGNFIFNDSFYAFYGTTAEAEGGYLMSREEYVKRFVHPDDMHILDQANEKRLLSRDYGFLNHVEHRIVRRTGEVRHILTRVRLSRDDAGNITKYYGANQDITERKQAEAVLEESESRFRGAFECAAIGMALVALDGRFLKANQSLCDSLGYSESELLVKTIRSITHEEDRENDREYRRRLIDDQFPYYQVEKRYEHRDGYIVWASLSVSMVRDAQGRPLYYIAQIEDITERKLLEEKVQTISIRDDLTGLYNRRAFFTLAEQQLRSASKTKERHTLFFAELDHTKQINDTLGHKEGDAALVGVAGILKDTFRETDIMGRIGGDEFAVLASGVEDASRLAVSLQANVESFNKRDGHSWPLSLSVGTAPCESEEFSSLEALISQADSVMYEEKQKKSRCVA
jgi:diguanylate cyclase (GGDEF)-like protein/PAS domain S-box-containing protein